MLGEHFLTSKLILYPKLISNNQSVGGMLGFLWGKKNPTIWSFGKNRKKGFRVIYIQPCSFYLVGYPRLRKKKNKSDILNLKKNIANQLQTNAWKKHHTPIWLKTCLNIGLKNPSLIKILIKGKEFKTFDRGAKTSH